MKKRRTIKNKTTSKRRYRRKSKVKKEVKKSLHKPVKGEPSRFAKGVSGNPNGRPKGSKNRFSIADLANAIKTVEKTKHKKFMEVWIECSWGDAAAMSNIANYMLPKLKSIEGFVATFVDSMEDDMAKTIQDRLKERYLNNES